MKQRKKVPLPLLQTGVGTILTSMIASGFLLGYFTDSYLNTKPVFMLMFGLLGIVGGIMKVYRLLINVPGFNVEKTQQRSRDKHTTSND